MNGSALDIRFRTRSVSVLAVLLLGLVGCGSNGDDANSTSTGTVGGTGSGPGGGNAGTGDGGSGSTAGSSGSGSAAGSSGSGSTAGSSGSGSAAGSSGSGGSGGGGMPATGTAYYVSPKGSDTNAGTISAPLLTITKARDVVRTVNARWRRHPRVSARRDVQRHQRDHVRPRTRARMGTASSTRPTPAKQRILESERSRLRGGLRQPATFTRPSWPARRSCGIST